MVGAVRAQWGHATYLQNVNATASSSSGPVDASSVEGVPPAAEQDATMGIEDVLEVLGPDYVVVPSKRPPPNACKKPEDASAVMLDFEPNSFLA